MMIFQIAAREQPLDATLKGIYITKIEKGVLIWQHEQKKKGTRSKPQRELPQNASAMNRHRQQQQSATPSILLLFDLKSQHQSALQGQK